jgi:hypothetical protein
MHGAGSGRLQIKIIAAILEQPVIEKILTHMGKAGARNASAASENRLKRTKRRALHLMACKRFC